MVMKCLQVIKALAGNDKVKTDAGKEFGILPLVVTSMDRWAESKNVETSLIFIQIRHVTRAGLVEAGCSAITSLTLRQSDNSCQVDSSWLLFNFNPKFADVDFARTFLITQNQL